MATDMTRKPQTRPSLKRRARSLNADMLLESRPGRGAGLKFRIPLQ